MSQSNELPNDAKAQAKADKAYKKAMRPWFKKKRFWLLGLFALGVISSALNGGGGGTASNAGSSQVEAVAPEAKTEAPAAEPEAPVVEVTTGQLLSDLEENALAAKRDWDGKRVTLTGKLRNIDSSGSYFTISGDAEFSIISVQVYIDESLVEAVSAFKKGQTVTVTGEITDVGEIMGYSVTAQSIP